MKQMKQRKLHYLKRILLVAAAFIGMIAVNSGSLTQADSGYYTTNPGIIKTKQRVVYYQDAARKVEDKTVPANHYAKITKVVVNAGQVPVLKTTTGRYLTASKAFVTKTAGYQNPKRYYQVQYQQIKPHGQVGYTVKRNFEGIKTWYIMRKMGTFAGYDKYNQATYNAVKRFQRRHHLKATGNVNEQTWVKMGFSQKAWTAIDSYVAPLGATASQGRSAHIEAMIHQAYRYLGNPYLVGSSSSPKYGTDCSGLVIQALYAGGINPLPVSAIHHAYPGNEWNSRNLWASKKFKHVAYSQRQRGDLVFYYQPGTHTIWHVAIYLGHNRVIESWPPKIMVQPIRNNQRSNVAGIARPFV
jgi:cell wall-associated NlpC family hydrolase